MAPTRLPVLIAATLAATSTAIEFSGQNDITQSAATVAPGSETQTSSTGSYGSTNQWTQTASSSNNVPTMAPTTPSIVSGSQGWSQPTTTDSSSGWTSPSVQASGSGNQGWSQPASTDSSNARTPSSGVSSGTGYQGGISLECSGSSDTQTPKTGGYSLECSGSSNTQTTETGGYSLECSGSDETTTAVNDYSLECSGSDGQQGVGSQPSVSTSTAGSLNAEPTTTIPSSTSSGAADQTWSQLSPTAASSASATSAASGEYESANPSTSSSNTATSTTSSGSSGNVEQGSSQVTQTSSSASSADTASSSTTGQSTASSSTTAQSTTQEGSGATQASTNSTSSGDHATFGTITSKSGECVIGNPNTYVSAADIDWVWTNRIGPNAPTREANWNVMDKKNWIMDQIVENKGTLNYCVRWDSTETLSKSTASKFQAMLERQYAAWNHWLVGYDCWPYNEIKVNVVGFAVKDASLLGWTDDSLGTITVGNLDSDGVPQCDQKCYRFYDVGIGSWTDTSACKGEPFDLSLWPKQGLEGGFSFEWGQQVNLENTISTLDQEELTIVSHEIGHGFGLPDFYETEDQPNAQWPKSIMMAGSSRTVTDSDGWMLRRVLEHLKPRYNF